jgi:hypothetical protein
MRRARPGWLKSLLFEKALCEKRQRSIKKLHHSVITFTPELATGDIKRAESNLVETGERYD